jgi:hypothetical protein
VAVADENCCDIEKWAILMRDSQLFSLDTLPPVLKEDPFLQVAKCIAWENLSASENTSVLMEMKKDKIASAVLADKDAEIFEERRQKEEAQRLQEDERRKKEEQRALKDIAESKLQKALSKLRELGYSDADFD